METKLLDQTGKEIGNMELNDSIFKVEMNEGLVHRALVYANAAARLNLAHTKTRGERRGSTRKIYKQKGTGRARMGGNRSPIRKKGGVVFGPRSNTNYELQMNRKERRKALYCVLSEKLKNKQLVVVDDIKLKEIGTKAMAGVFSKLPYEQKALLAIAKKDEVLEKSTSNLKNVKSVLVDYINVHDLLKYNTLVLLKATVEALNSSAK